MNIHLIWAQEQGGGIGIKNSLPWHISEDLKNFKKLTLNKVIVMGRKTWDSLPVKPLPNRRNIVLSSSKINNIEVYSSVKHILKYLKGETDIFIIGGAEVYKQFFEYANILHITIVYGKTVGVDTFFPINFSTIKTNFVCRMEKSLTENAKYTFWEKVI